MRGRECSVAGFPPHPWCCRGGIQSARLPCSTLSHGRERGRGRHHQPDSDRVFVNIDTVRRGLSGPRAGAGAGARTGARRGKAMTQFSDGEGVPRRERERTRREVPKPPTQPPTPPASFTMADDDAAAAAAPPAAAAPAAQEETDDSVYAPPPDYVSVCRAHARGGRMRGDRPQQRQAACLLMGTRHAFRRVVAESGPAARPGIGRLALRAAILVQPPAARDGRQLARRRKGAAAAPPRHPGWTLRSSPCAPPLVVAGRGICAICRAAGRAWQAPGSSFAQPAPGFDHLPAAPATSGRSVAQPSWTHPHSLLIAFPPPSSSPSSPLHPILHPHSGRS